MQAINGACRVNLGRGKRNAGAGLGAAILRALAVGRAGDGGEIPIRAGRGAGVFQLPSALPPSAAHHQLGRRLVQTFAPLFEPFPWMSQRRAQRAGPRLLPAGTRIHASLRTFMNRSALQLTFNRNRGQCQCWCLSSIIMSPLNGYVKMSPHETGENHLAVRMTNSHC
jgi:hypothetical protein